MPGGWTIEDGLAAPELLLLPATAPELLLVPATALELTAPAAAFVDDPPPPPHADRSRVRPKASEVLLTSWDMPIFII